MKRTESGLRHPRSPSSAAARAVGILCACVLALADTPGLAGQQRTAVLQVTVVGAGADIAIAGALVRVGGTGLTARTLADGTARLADVPVGVAVVSVDAPGFLADRSLITFEPGTVVEVTFVLDPAPIPLPGVAVQAPRRSQWLEGVGFYERAGGGLGTFLLPEDLAERTGRAARLSDLLRAIPGLRVTPNPSAPGTYVVESRRGNVSFTQACRPGFWLDGVPITMPRNVSVDMIAHPAEILAIEVYDGPADVPSAFQASGGACGAVLLWTGGRGRR